MAIEGIKDGERFKAFAQEAAEREKPIVVLKLGSTQAGTPRRRVAHRAPSPATTTSSTRCRASTGSSACTKSRQLYETAVLLRKRRWPKGRGAASVVADRRQHRAGRRRGRHVRRRVAGVFAPRRRPRSRSFCRATARSSNPTDMTSLATGRRDLYRSALDDDRRGPERRRDGADLRVGHERRSPARRRFRHELREGRGDAVGRRLHRRSRVHAEGVRESGRAGVSRRDAVHARDARGDGFRRLREGAQGRATITPQRPAGIDREAAARAARARAATSSPSAKRSRCSRPTDFR